MLITNVILHTQIAQTNCHTSEGMSPEIRTEDLIDASGIAGLLGLAHRNTVSVYQKRYPDMPRPVINLAGGRTRLWVRSEVLDWAQKVGRSIEPSEADH